jgi:hypothetical protein
MTLNSLNKKIKKMQKIIKIIKIIKTTNQKINLKKNRLLTKNLPTWSEYDIK